MNSLLQFLAQFGAVLQDHLFPALREELGPLSDRHEQLVRAMALLHLDGFVCVRHGRGRPPHDRAKMARAFLAKAVFNFPHTRALLDRLHADIALRRLCGWERVAQIPDETVFSRAFAEFAQNEFPQRVHAALVQRAQGERLVGHILRDSTAIEARERAQPKVAPKAPSQRRRHKSKKPKRPEQMTRLDRQCSGTMSVEEMLAELPRGCDVGCKTNSKGSKNFWVGYKLHLDVADGQIPISCVLTSASLNDTQVAVPLALLTAQRVTSLYDLMDMGYDSDQIREHSVQLGHVPIIPRRKLPSSEEKPVMDPHQQVRFRERTTVERVYGRLKEEFGGQFVRVRGGAKVMAHLMFGILALTADQILRLMRESATVPT
jgi:transposase